MFLQILPPDFQYALEPTVTNSAELISLATLTIVAIVIGSYLIVKNITFTKKPAIISEVVSIWNFCCAIIKKDLRIN